MIPEEVLKAIKTKEEILRTYAKDQWLTEAKILQAMEEYASQFKGVGTKDEFESYVEKLRTESFAGWSEEAVHGYMTAIESVSHKYAELKGKDLVSSGKAVSSDIGDAPFKTCNSVEQKFHAVEFAGYWTIKTEPFYDAGKDILNAEDVGQEQAEHNANTITKLLNDYYAKGN